MTKRKAKHGETQVSLDIFDDDAWAAFTADAERDPRLYGRLSFHDSIRGERRQGGKAGWKAAFYAEMAERVYYFAYGSNLNVKQMQDRCPSARRVGVAYLADWQLVFRGPADIRKADGAVVPGALYDIDGWDLRTLDRREGEGRVYKRIVVRVYLEAEDRVVRAYVYTMTRDRSRSFMLPTEPYLRRVSTGYGHWGLETRPLVTAVKDAGQWLRKNGLHAVRLEGGRYKALPYGKAAQSAAFRAGRLP